MHEAFRVATRLRNAKAFYVSARLNTAQLNSRGFIPDRHEAILLLKQFRRSVGIIEYHLQCVVGLVGPSCLGLDLLGLENGPVVCHYAASGGTFLPTFGDNLSVPSAGLKA